MTNETSWYPPDTEPAESELIPPGTDGKPESDKDPKPVDTPETAEASTDKKLNKQVISFKV